MMPEYLSSHRIAKAHRRISSSWRWQAPEDASRIILDFAAGTLLELLSLALADKQFHILAIHRLLLELDWFGIKTGTTRHLDLQKVLMPQVAQRFVELPKLALCSPCISDEEVPSHSFCDAFAPFGEDEAVLHCQECYFPILKANDIISSSYRIMTGRAFLTATAYNISKSEETYEASYTTGEYTVRQVCCGRCSTQLGITYVGANDMQNEYKIGKFLLGQNILVRPQCCLFRAPPFAGGLDLPTSFCRRCKHTAGRGILELVNYMTKGLKDLRRTRRLHDLLSSQLSLEGLQENRGLPNRGCKLAPRPGAVVSWCFPLLRSHSSSTQTSEQSNALACGVRPPWSAESAAPPSAMRCWQDVLKERLGMLRCLQPLIQEAEHLYVVLTAVVRFVGVFCRAAQSSAPQGAVGACGPRRVSALLQLLPALIVPGRRDAMHSAGALALAVRKEWLSHSTPATEYHGRSFDANGSAVPTWASLAPPLSAAELEAIESAITAWALERDRPPRREPNDSEGNATRVAAELTPQTLRAAAPRTQPTPSRSQASSLLPRARSQPPSRARASTVESSPMLQPPVQHAQQGVASTGEIATLSRTARSQDAQRLVGTDVQAARTISVASTLDSDEEDNGAQCCSACSASSVKATLRGQPVPQSSRESMNTSCVCRPRRVVVIKRYLRCIVPQAAASTTSITSNRAPSVHPLIQGDVASSIVATTQSTPALPWRLPTRVMLPSGHD